MKIKVTKLPKSEIEIEGELESELFESYFPKALKKLGDNLELPGFRKSKAPENVLVQNLGEMRILEEMAQMALGEAYPKMIEDEKLDVINRPEISITKLARNNPLGFKIKTAILPEITLPDYKKIATKAKAEITEKEKDVSVSDEDVENTILDIRKSRAPKVHMKAPTPEGVGVPAPDDDQSVGKELPELNDEFVQALGPFKDVADFKIKLKENIKLEKGNQVREKTRLKIIESIVDETKVELPEILIDIELNKIIYRMESDITQMGLKFEDYLKHLNKTTEDLRKEFRTDGEKKAKLGLVLNEIAKIEKLSPEEETVAKEVEHIMEHYKDADRERAHLHAENVLTNEKVFVFLESQ